MPGHDDKHAVDTIRTSQREQQCASVLPKDQSGQHAGTVAGKRRKKRGKPARTHLRVEDLLATNVAHTLCTAGKSQASFVRNDQFRNMREDLV